MVLAWMNHSLMATDHQFSDSLFLLTLTFFSEEELPLLPGMNKYFSKGVMLASSGEKLASLSPSSLPSFLLSFLIFLSFFLFFQLFLSFTFYFFWLCWRAHDFICIACCVQIFEHFLLSHTRRPRLTPGCPCSRSTTANLSKSPGYSVWI